MIDRDDKTINICEAKYYNDELVIDGKYAEELRHKISTFKIATKTTKKIKLTFITAFGVRENMYSKIIDSEVRIEDLFKDEI
ncbi:MAG: hypothetical protein MJ211_04845 [Bacteroidales bacterium]|nr:hypothetical protein [Bacteroidales bacterium]